MHTEETVESNDQITTTFTEATIGLKDDSKSKQQKQNQINFKSKKLVDATNKKQQNDLFTDDIISIDEDSIPDVVEKKMEVEEIITLNLQKKSDKDNSGKKRIKLVPF